MSLEHTGVEKRLISAAYTEIDYWAGMHERDNVLAVALREERAARSCTTSAKAMIVRAFLDGWTLNPRASEISVYASSLRPVVVLGAEAYSRDRAKGEMKGFVASARAAVEAHEDAVQRMLARYREDYLNNLLKEGV